MQIPSAAPRRKNLSRLILAALVAGIVVGCICHAMIPTVAATREVAGYISIGTDIFLRLIKMIIAPLVFATIVSGIASLGDSSTVGRVAGRSLFWFIVASVISLGLGLAFANMFQPGLGMSFIQDPAVTDVRVPEATLSVKDFVTHIFPTSAIQAMASNEILQIVVFAVFFGFALTGVKGTAGSRIIPLVDELVQVMLRVTNAVMRFAPLGVFAAITAVVTTQGPGVIVTFAKLIGSFYLALIVLWAILIGVGAVFLGRSVLRLVRCLREPMMVAFSTASAEAAFPKMIEQLTSFGVSRRIAGFVLPLGYSFNLDGSMMYQAFAALFIAQAYGIDMSITEQVGLLLLMMLTSKGSAGVPRASLVVLAATLPLSKIPVEGLALIIGIDHLLDMGRTMTNVVGNGIATAVVAKWEGELDPARTVPDEAAQVAAHAEANRAYAGS